MSSRFNLLQPALSGAAIGIFAAAGLRLVPGWCDGSLQALSIACAITAAGLVLGALAVIAAGRRRRAEEPVLPILPEPSEVTVAARAATPLRIAAPAPCTWLVLALFVWLALAPLVMPAVITAGLSRWGGRMPAFGSFLWWQAGILSLALFPPALLTGALVAARRRSAAAAADTEIRPYETDSVGADARAGTGTGGVGTGTLLVGVLAGWLWLVLSAGVAAGLLTASVVGALSVVLLPVGGRWCWVVWMPALMTPLLLGLALRGGTPLLARPAIGGWLATQGAIARQPGALAAHCDGGRHALTLRSFGGDGRLLYRDGERLLALPGDLPAATLAVQVPLMLHPAPARLALLDLQGGVELAAAAGHPLKSIECAAVDPAHLPVIRRTLADGHGAERCLDDRRVTLSRRPVASLLRDRRERYDIIVAPAAPPWTAPGARMLTHGAFEAARRALATNGLLCVGIDTQTLAPERLHAVMGAFAGVFPEMQVWSPQLNRLLLVGAAGKFPFEAEGMLERMEHRPSMRALSRVGVRTLPDLLACLTMAAPDIRRFLAEGGAEKSSAPYSWRSLARDAARGRLSPEGNRATLARIERSRTWSLATLSPGGLDPDLFRALRERAVRQIAARAALMELFAGTAGVAGEAAASRQVGTSARLNPDDAFLNRLLLAMEQQAAYALARRDYTGAARRYAGVAAIVPERASALYGSAMAERGLGRDAAAHALLVRAVAAAPGEPACRQALAEVAFALGNEVEAVGHYRMLLERDGDDPEALAGLAVCLGHGTPAIRDIDEAIAAAERAAVLTRYRDARITSILADLYVDNGRVIEGVSLKRRIKLADREKLIKK